MRDYFDASVLVAAMVQEEPGHESCLNAWLAADSRVLLLHGVLESFASLTGGKKPHLRLPGRTAAAVLRDNIGEFQARVVSFDADETLGLLLSAQASGVRGGAVYDYLHLRGPQSGCGTDFHVEQTALHRHRARFGIHHPSSGGAFLIRLSPSRVGRPCCKPQALWLS